MGPNEAMGRFSSATSEPTRGGVLGQGSDVGARAQAVKDASRRGWGGRPRLFAVIVAREARAGCRRRTEVVGAGYHYVRGRGGS